VAFRSNGSRQFGRITSDHGDGNFDILVSRSGGQSGKGQCRTDAAEDIGKIARTTVGWAFRQRFDVLAARALLQSSDGIKFLVSLVKQGNFPSSCSDHTGVSSFFDSSGKLKLDVSMQSGENSGRGEWPDAGCRRNVPNLLNMRIIASGLSSLYGILVALDVSGHTNLERIPVKELVAIKSLQFLGCCRCRRLVSPPTGIAEQGGFAVMDYLRLARPEEGGMFSNTIELILVGRSETGKTSVIRSLQQGKSEKIEEDRRTVGIDLLRWDLSDIPNALGLKFNVRDLAGEAIYRLSHQYFMVKKALFVLVWRVIPKISGNLHPFEEEVYAMVTEWLETVQLRVPGARILIVATHIDCAHESEVDRQCKRVKALIRDKVEELKEDELVSGIPAPIVWKHGDSLRVNCVDGTGVEELRLQLIEMAHDLPWWQEGIPGCYLNLKNVLRLPTDATFTASRRESADDRRDRTWLSWTDYVAIASGCGVVGNHLEIATRSLHDDATLAFFGQFPKSEADHQQVAYYASIFFMLSSHKHPQSLSLWPRIHPLHAKFSSLCPVRCTFRFAISST
jgi:GTPase SAR1 family protein